MSVKVMSWVWDNGPASGAERLVLLALADFCDDAGRCWPSMARIAAKGCVTERGAQKIIRRLEAEGWVKIATGGGRHGCNEYQLTIGNPELETVNHVHPERGSPRTGEQKPRTRVQETPNHGSPEPSGTIIEPSEDKKELSTTTSLSTTQRATEVVVADPPQDERPDDWDFFRRVLGAARINPDDLPGKYWMPPAAVVEVGKWRDLPEITDARILECVAAEARRFTAPPNGPKAFEGAIGRLAAALTAGPPSPRPTFAQQRADAEREARRSRWKRIAAGGRA